MLKSFSSVRQEDGVIGGDLEDVLRDGASIRQLAKAFRSDVNTIRRKLNAAGVKPSGERGGFPVFAIYDAAPYLHRLASANAASTDENNKALWAAKMAKLDYEERIGSLIETSVAREALSVLFNMIRTEALLIRDAVEREVELTSSQRNVVLRYVDLLLTNANAIVVKQFPEKMAKPAEQEREWVDADRDSEL